MISRERFNEGSSGFIQGQIVNQDGVAVDADLLTAGTLTLYDMDTGEILNDRDNQDILGAGSPLGANNVIYEGDGYFQWDLRAAQPGVSPAYPGDNVIVTARRQAERHRAMFHFEWVGGAFNYELEIEVVNLRKVLDV